VPLLSGRDRNVGALIVTSQRHARRPAGLVRPTVWRDGLPLVLGTDGVIDGHTAIDCPSWTPGSSVCCSRLTDHAVANQLGLSMRSVQRRIRALMDLVAAETRLQLGFHAARRGWL
jgi:hypothetical protein